MLNFVPESNVINISEFLSTKIICSVQFIGSGIRFRGISL